MMMVTYSLNAVVLTFVSNYDSFFLQDASGDYVENPDFQFELHDVWLASEQFDLGTAWPYDKSTYWNDRDTSAFQQLSLINQVDDNGVESVYIIGAYNTSKLAPVINGDDIAVLFKVNGYPDDIEDASGEIKFAPLAVKHLRMKTHDEEAEDAQHGNGNAGVGAYVSPTRELILYSTSHNDNDKGKGPNGNSYPILRMAEFRHYEMAHSGNVVGPKFRPNHLGGPITVSQNTDVVLDASSYYIRSWVDFYEDGGFNGDVNAISQLMEVHTQHKEDFDNFSDLDGRKRINNGLNDRVSSLRIGLEVDDIFMVYKDKEFDYSSILFGFVVTPGGNARSELIEISQLPDASDDKISSAEFVDYTFYGDFPIFDEGVFGTFAAALAKITTPDRALNATQFFGRSRHENRAHYRWDLDNDGTYEYATFTPHLPLDLLPVGEHVISLEAHGITHDVDGNLLQKIVNVEELLVLMPDFIGVSKGELNSVGGAKDVDIAVSNQEVFDDFIPEGHIVTQSIPAGTEVGAGTRVVLTPSKGLAMKDLIGKTEAQARAILESVGLVLGKISYGPRAGVPKGLIFDQEISAGVAIEKGTEIDVKISSASGLEVNVPDVIGLESITAQDTLSAEELTVGDIEEEYHPTIPAGIVLAQLPLAGVEVEEGEAVDLVISKGPAPEIKGDIDLDGDVDTADLGLLFSAMNQPASSPDDKRDLDGDGMITALDARKLVLLFCSKDECN